MAGAGQVGRLWDLDRIIDNYEQRINTLEKLAGRSVSVTAWSTSGADIALSAGWTQTDTFATRDMAIRLEGDMVTLTGTMLNRTGSGLAVLAANGYDIVTVSTDYRPPSLTFIENGSIGVNGALGSCALWVSAAGVIQFIPLVASGTISTAGGFTNSVGLPTMRWRIS